MTVEEILDELNIPRAPEGHHHRTAGWVQIDCPFCSPGSKKYRMGIGRNGHGCNCWVCGPKRVLMALAEASGRPGREIISFLKGVDTDWIKPIPVRGTLQLPAGIEPFLLKAHTRFIEARGFEVKQLVRLWGIKGIGLEGGSLCWRLFIPIVYRDLIVSWTTRSISNDVKNRYVSASPAQEAIDHKTLLYGEDYCRHTVVVVEGPTDVWRVGPGAAATFGTGFTTAQVERISKYPTRVVCYDSAPEAQERARELADQLEPFPGETVIVQLDADDPGSASAGEIRRLRKLYLE